MGRKIAITLTTINKPAVIGNLIRQELEPEDSLEIVIVGDLNTPIEAVEFINSFDNSNPSVVVTYLGPNDQELQFSQFSELWKHIPFKSFSRRNFGDLYCLLNDHEYIIRIDDDNFPLNTKFVADHVIALQKKQGYIIDAKSGWFNVCELLREKNDKYFYPRGFPYKFRDLSKSGTVKVSQGKTNVMVNAGLWLGDPDIDAITRLALAPHAISMEIPVSDSYVMLGANTWSPINTQNTGYTKEALKISFVSPHVGRYDDIFAGYILRAIADKLNWHVSYGKPLVEQKRNIHDLWKDESLERFGNTSGVEVIEFLKSYNIASGKALDAYEELSFALRESFGQVHSPINLMCDGMDCWIKAVRDL